MHSVTMHHLFATDLQLQMYVTPNVILKLFHSMLSCVRDVKSLATAYMLKN